MFYAGWYPRQWLPFGAVNVPGAATRGLAKHMRYAARTSRKLARALFHAMVRFGPKLERQQVLLGRFVDIGTELFAITATCLRAQSLMKEVGKSAEVRELADYFCNSARLRIAHLFRDFTTMPTAKAIGSRKKFWTANRIGCKKEFLANDSTDVSPVR